MRTTTPKVFISYSWAQNRDRVLDLADRLRGDGVDAVIDEYDFKEGTDKYVFMEQCVTDPSIEKVLVICDKSYKIKADERAGGVGDEITVMSPKIYEKAKQEKYIPVVFERDENGDPYLPALLASRKYIDMSGDAVFEDGYSRLLHNLWEEPERKKPPLGHRPEWVSNSLGVNTAKIEQKINRLLNNPLTAVQGEMQFRRIMPDFLEVLQSIASEEIHDMDIVRLIELTLPIRDAILRTVESYLLVLDSDGEVIAAEFEKLYNAIPRANKFNDERDLDLFECYQFFFWELFIAITALLLHYERYSAIHEFLTHRYFAQKMSYYERDFKERDFTWFREHLERLEGKEIREKYKYEQKITVTGELLHSRGTSGIITGDALVRADLFLSQMAMALTTKQELEGKNYLMPRWFPTSYVYESHAPQPIWGQLVSKRHCQRLLPLFGVKTVAEMIAMLKQADEIVAGMHGSWRHHNAFECPLPVKYSIKWEEVGSRP